MDSFNNSLLSFITKNETYGQDVKSLRKRYQNLSLIYINLIFTVFLVFFNLVSELFSISTNNSTVLMACLPLSLLSFFFLRIGKVTLSLIMIILDLHAANIVVSYTTNRPLLAIFGVLIYPFMVFALTPDFRIHWLNIVLCFLEFTFDSIQSLKIFEVTMNDDQKEQIISVILGSFCCCTIAVGISVFQKRIETHIWNLAHENYLKSENLTKEVIQAMEAKDNFVSMLSHEIRNPLNALKGSIEYLSQTIKEKDSLQVLKNAKMSGDILLNLVNNVLDAAKLKSDKMEIISMETNLVDTIEKVFTINSEKFKEKRLFAKAFIDENLPKLLWIDPSRLLQILMNLISNSVKFTPKGGKIKIYVAWCHYKEEKDNLLKIIKKDDLNEVAENMSQNIISEENKRSEIDSSIFDEFSFEEEYHHLNRMQSLNRIMMNQSKNDLSLLDISCCEASGECWSLHKTHFDHQDNENQNKGFLKIQITDTGCGIEEHELSKVFGMFEQTKQGIRSVHGGTGLGLWICKQLCHKMHGDITVYSKPSKGTSFVLYIPIDNNPVKIKLASSSESLIKENPKALVVDDYSVNRYLHKLLLEQEGVQVSLACNGREALEKYKSQTSDPYDFILMDVRMPEMDGFTATNLIREWENENKTRKVDIYFVTGEYFNEEDVMRKFARQGGQNAGIRYLKKPLDGDVLTRIVTQYKKRTI